MSQRLWKIIEYKGDYIIFPKINFYCPFCANELLIHDFCPYYNGVFYYCDVHMKCINCSFWCTFGVRISEEEYRKLVNSKFKAKTLLHELKDLYPPHKDEIAERLKNWGYW